MTDAPLQLLIDSCDDRHQSGELVSLPVLGSRLPLGFVPRSGDKETADPAGGKRQDEEKGQVWRDALMMTEGREEVGE